MAKPENSFIRGIHDHLPPELHHEKMHNPYRGGTADTWYSGKRDIWVEYKFEELPKRPDTIVPIDLSALQVEWLKKRLKEGRRVFVIVGCKAGGVIFEKRAWEIPLPLKEFQPRIISRKEIAAWIMQQTGGPP